jgi:hypothetical protein
MVRCTGCPTKRVPKFGWLFIAVFWVKNVFQHESKSEPLRSYLINLFPVSFCPCVPYHPLRHFHRRPTNRGILSWGAFNLHFLQDELPLLLDDVPLQVRLNMWLQYSSTPPHCGRQVAQYLSQCYGNRWIGRGGPHAWPPVRQTWHPLISTCGCTWRTWCIRRHCVHEMNSYKWGTYFNIANGKHLSAQRINGTEEIFLHTFFGMLYITFIQIRGAVWKKILYFLPPGIFGEFSDSLL